MSTLPTYGADDLDQAIAAGYASVARLPANVGVGSQFGPLFKSVRNAIMLLQNENEYIDQISRLQNMPDPLPSGAPNPDVDTFINAFGFIRPGASYTSGTQTFTMPSNVTQDLPIRVGTIVQTPEGTQYQAVPGGMGYNPSANAYIMTAGTKTVNALVVCVTPGSIGNAVAGSISQVYPLLGGPSLPASLTTTNQADYTNGLDALVGAPLKSLFALYISGGGEGTVNSILAATGLTPNYTNLIYSIGDLYMVATSGVSSGSLVYPVPGWFTLVVNIANQGTALPPQALLNAVNAELLYQVRAAGISYSVIAPTLVQVAGAGTVSILPGFDPMTVINAVNAAYINFANGTGLDQYGNPTYITLMGAYAALASIPGVQKIDGLTLNGGTADIEGLFGTQLVAGSAGFTY